MLRRRALSLALLLLPALARAQTRAGTTDIQAIGAGPFEFPITGSFRVQREGRATVFSAADESIRFTVGFFQRRSEAAASDDPLAAVEALARNSWERFAKSENGRIVRAFERVTSPSGLTLFSMATEFKVNSDQQYYVQFAVTDGARVGTLFAEGFGSALSSLRELEPKVRQVRIAQ
jgi:hypothetical protein